jgi:hypothetical protein
MGTSSARQGAAAWLVDLQRDFSGADGSRMPGEADGAGKAMRSAKAILDKRVPEGAIALMGG